MKRVFRVGCAVLAPLALCTLLSPPQSAAQASQEPADSGATTTFAEHIAPILFRSCTPCHRPGQTAPFPLTTYQEARRRGRLLGKVVQEGFMPPWLPGPETPPLANDRSLSEEEVQLLLQWYRDKTPPGDLEAMPPLPASTPIWSRGTPDLVVEAKDAYQMPADALNVTRNFVFPLDLEEDRWVRAVALNAGSAAVLRGLLFVDATGATADAGPDDLEAVIAENPSLGFSPLAGLGGEVVNDTAWPFPEGTALPLAKGSSVVLQVYFEPLGVEETIRPQLGFYYAEEPPSRTLVTLSLGRRDLEIPAGEADYAITGSFKLPVDVEAVGITPHAHRIAREIKGRALLPDGSETWLLAIDEWDFAYQDSYWFRDPLELPAGTVVEMDVRYDNTDENENNPNYPAATMTWNQTLKGEMAGLHLRVVPKNKKDLKKLEKAYGDYLKTAGLR